VKLTEKCCKKCKNNNDKIETFHKHCHYCKKRDKALRKKGYGSVIYDGE